MKHSNATVAGFVLNDAPTGLEFPDWSGLKPHRVRLSPAEAFRWNEEMIGLFPDKANSWRQSSLSKCSVEFKL
jgi:hypothetical protein